MPSQAHKSIIVSDDKKTNSKSTPSHSFCQARPFFSCNKHDVLKAVSKKEGYCAICRDPRCSFECAVAHARKWSSIIVEYLKQQGSKYIHFKGCLKLKTDANQEDHCEAVLALSKAVSKLEKELDGTVRYIGKAHITNPTNKHYDYLAYASKSVANRAMARFKEVARESGFVHATAKMVSNPQQLKNWSDYMFKRYSKPRKTRKFLYLHAKDGSDTLIGSRRFFIDKSAKQVWEELTEKYRLQGTTPMNSSSPSSPLEKVIALNMANLPLKDKIEAILPWKEEDAMTPASLQWLVRSEELHFEKTLLEIEGIIRIGSCIYRPGDEEGTWLEKWFDNIVPYHAQHFPHLVSHDVAVGEICNRDAGWWLEYLAKKKVLSKDEFMAELMSLKYAA